MNTTRKIHLVGALKGKTTVKAGVQFVNGTAVLNGEIGEVDALHHYLRVGYQVITEEERQNGLSAPETDGPNGSVPSLAGDVPKEGRTPEGSSDEGSGHAGSEGGGQGVPSKGDGQGCAEDQLIQDALSKLDSDNDEHWTADSRLPMIAAVCEMIPGVMVSRADINRLAPDMRRPDGKEAKIPETSGLASEQG